MEDNDRALIAKLYAAFQGRFKNVWEVGREGVLGGSKWLDKQYLHEALEGLWFPRRAIHCPDEGVGFTGDLHPPTPLSLSLLLSS